MDLVPFIKRYMDLKRQGDANFSQFGLMRQITPPPTKQLSHVSKPLSIHRRLLHEPSLSALSQALVAKIAVYEAELTAIYVVVLSSSRKTQEMHHKSTCPARPQPASNSQGR